MEQKKRERNKCLLVWIRSLPPFRTSRNQIPPTNDDFRDGRMTSRILKMVIDPVYFQDLSDCPKESTELVKVVERMKKYLVAQTGHTVANNLVPNAGKIITSGDIQEINRLLQLILSCAVNSGGKEAFIKEIMQMEKTLQFDLMEAIQEMLARDDKEESIEIGDVDLTLQSQVASLNDIIERISQEKHELKSKLSEITEEKVALLTENEKLNNQLTAHLNDPESIQISLKLQEEYKRECEHLREENFRLEASIDDSNARIQVLEKDLAEIQSKLVLSQSYQDDALRNKDEVDSLREAAARIPQLENSIQSYKKKLEGLEYVKRSMKDLNEQNEKLLKNNISLEDEVLKVSAWKSQVEDFKKKLIETQQSLSQESQKSSRARFELERAKEKIDSIQTLADRLQEEKSALTIQLDELRQNGTVIGISELHADTANSMDLIPAHARQRITRLEIENEELRKKLRSPVLVTTDEGSRVIVEELRRREAEQDEELLKKNQDLVDLRLSSEEKIRNLESVIQSKDDELKKKENQYKKCMDKAKSVITTLEPTGTGGLEPQAHSSTSKSEADIERVRAIQDREEKLLAAAFYSYGLTLHRNAVEGRNTTLLQKHRQNLSNPATASTSGSSSASSSRRKSEF